jgi:hypothetical protein
MLFLLSLVISSTSAFMLPTFTSTSFKRTLDKMRAVSTSSSALLYWYRGVMVLLPG